MSRSFRDPKIAALTGEQLDSEIREYRSLLNAQVSEQELHAFLAERSYFFSGVLRLGGASPLYSKIRLGNEHEVDFVWFETGSSGAEWRLAELEAPSRSMFTKSGEPSKWLNHALQQVRDWHSWIHENLDYARKLMPHVEYPFGYIMIGRRRDLTAATAKRLRRLCYEHRQFVEVHTLDWLAELAAGTARFISNEGGTWNTPAKAFSHVDLRQRRPRSAFNWLFSPYPTAMATKGVQDRLRSREYTWKDNEDVEAALGYPQRKKFEKLMQQNPLPEAPPLGS